MSQVRENPGFSALITPHIQNIGTLHINRISTIEELAQTFPDFPRSMPNLRSFSFSPSLGFNQDWSTDPFEAFTPALTHLSLEFLPLYPSLLRLRTLMNLTIHNLSFDVHLDTFLDFLEGNRALERANIHILFKPSSLQNLRGQDPFTNRLKTLLISSNAAGGSALISRIALQRGATLEASCDGGVGLSDILSIASSLAHLQILHEATFMEYHPECGTFRLVGPNGTFSLAYDRGNPFSEFHLLHLTHAQAFHFIRCQLALGFWGAPNPPAPVKC